MTTVAQAHRQLVGDMFAEGVEVEEIARRVGISVDRVDAILDQMDGVEHQDDAHRAPSVEPVRPNPAPPVEDRQPIVVGSKARVVPSVPPKPVEVRPVPLYDAGGLIDPGTTLGDLMAKAAREDTLTPADEPPGPAGETEPEPEPVKATPTPVRPSPPPVKPAERPAAELSCGDKQGTRAGYQRHTRRGEHGCDPCITANREYQRTVTRARKESAPAKDLMQVIEPTFRPADVGDEAAGRVRAALADALAKPKARTGPRPCGTQAAYKRHLRHGEKPCAPCVEAHSEYMRSYRDRPVLDKPEGAVALLTLPISVPHLIAVGDALELAYGPGLRIVGADGGFWVLGRAS